MTDPYAVRARTHRSDGHPTEPMCRRCGNYWPCPKAGRTDPEPRYRWALLLAALAAAATLAVACGGWLLGWW